MKSISASIVVLSGAILLAAGSFVAHDQTKGFVQGVGVVVGLTGLVVWLLAVKAPRE